MRAVCVCACVRALPAPLRLLTPSAAHCFLPLSSLSSLARFASFARTQLKEMLRFNPDRGAMKKRLESLIDREYVERDMTDRAVVHYMPA